MPIDFTWLNGRNHFIDDQLFERSVNNDFASTCDIAHIALLNHFPATISAEVRADLVIMGCIHNRRGNYFRVRQNDTYRYFYNWIVPIYIIPTFHDLPITIDEQQDCLVDDKLYDYATDNHLLKTGISNYLVYRCGFIKRDLWVFPLVFIQHPTALQRSCLAIAPSLTWQVLRQHLLHQQVDRLCSYRRWQTDEGYPLFVQDLSRINAQAAIDSASGYITRRKVDRIASRLLGDHRRSRRSRASDEMKLFDDDTLSALEQAEKRDNAPGDLRALTIIAGRAGTGKTTELVFRQIEAIVNGLDTLFLTYNHLLVYDITTTIKRFVDGKVLVAEKANQVLGAGRVQTLHSFFYRVARSATVLLAMSERRFVQLQELLQTRINRTLEEIRYILAERGEKLFHGNVYAQLIGAITASARLQVQEKQVAIDFVHFLQANNFSITDQLEQTARQFAYTKSKWIEELVGRDVFLQDYYEVLKNTLLALENPKVYYDLFDIGSKFDLLQGLMQLETRYQNNPFLRQEIIPLEIFVQRINRMLGQHRRTETLLVDEAQDCHGLERDILYYIFQPPALTIASGGREQLIRHSNVCQWTTWKGHVVPFREHTMQKRSYRIKKNILSLCNYLAQRYGIRLELEPIHSVDTGEVIIDCRVSADLEQLDGVFRQLISKGSLQECTVYESVIVMIASSQSVPSETAVRINEYGNILEDRVRPETIWPFKEALAEHAVFWDGTLDDVRRQTMPGANEARLIYYESCRGLEAWSIACFDLDEFFEKKRGERAAENYLLDDLHLQLEERRDMYAMTWVLMALSRGIDTAYIKIANPGSSLAQVLTKYARESSGGVRLLT